MYHAEILQMSKEKPNRIGRQYVVGGDNIADLVIRCAEHVMAARNDGNVVRVNVEWRGDWAEAGGVE